MSSHSSLSSPSSDEETLNETTTNNTITNNNKTYDSSDSESELDEDDRELIRENTIASTTTAAKNNLASMFDDDEADDKEEVIDDDDYDNDDDISNFIEDVDGARNDDDNDDVDSPSMQNKQNHRQHHTKSTPWSTSTLPPRIVSELMELFGDGYSDYQHLLDSDVDEDDDDDGSIIDTSTTTTTQTRIHEIHEIPSKENKTKQELMDFPERWTTASHLYLLTYDPLTEEDWNKEADWILHQWSNSPTHFNRQYIHLCGNGFCSGNGGSNDNFNNNSNTNTFYPVFKKIVLSVLFSIVKERLEVPCIATHRKESFSVIAPPPSAAVRLSLDDLWSIFDLHCQYVKHYQNVLLPPIYSVHFVDVLLEHGSADSPDRNQAFSDWLDRQFRRATFSIRPGKDSVIPGHLQPFSSIQNKPFSACDESSNSPSSNALTTSFLPCLCLLKEGLATIEVGLYDDDNDDNDNNDNHNAGENVRKSLKNAITEEYIRSAEEGISSQVMRELQSKLMQLPYNTAEPVDYRRILTVVPTPTTTPWYILYDTKTKMLVAKGPLVLEDDGDSVLPECDVILLSLKPFGLVAGTASAAVPARGSGGTSSEALHKALKAKHPNVQWVIADTAPHYVMSPRALAETAAAQEKVVQFALAVTRRYVSPLEEILSMGPTELRSFVGEICLSLSTAMLFPSNLLTWSRSRSLSAAGSGGGGGGGCVAGIEKQWSRKIERSFINVRNLLGWSPGLSGLSLIAGLGPRAEAKILGSLKEGTLKRREDIAGVLSEILYRNASSFIILRHSPSPLDSTRIHPENYYLATKMALDAVEDEDEGGGDGGDEEEEEKVLRRVMMKENSSKLDQLMLDEYDSELQRLGLPSKLLTLKDCRLEMQRPFRDLRGRGWGDEDVLVALTGIPTASLLGRHAIVDGVIHSITSERGVEGRLSSTWGCLGFWIDEGGHRSRKRYRVGDVLSNLSIQSCDLWRRSVVCRDEGSSFRRKDPLDPYGVVGSGSGSGFGFDYGSGSSNDTTKTTTKKTMIPPSVTRHPMWTCKTLQEVKEQWWSSSATSEGEAVFLCDDGDGGSSLLLAYKLKEGLVGRASVKCKAAAHSCCYEVDGQDYGDLDEVVGRFLSGRMSLLRELYRCPKFFSMDGVVEEGEALAAISAHLQKQRESNGGRRISYCLSVCRRTFNVLLSLLGGRTCRHEQISLSQRYGFTIDRCKESFVDLGSLVAWMKANHQIMFSS